MPPRPTTPTPLMRPRLRPESCRALLRLLGAQPVPWSELANTVARDALLCWSILSCLPLTGRFGEGSLAELVETRLMQLGADLLRAWALQASAEACTSAALEQSSAHSALVAELALHLATETAYRRPQEAYLAGLWHELGALFEDGDPSGIEDGNPLRQAEASVQLAARACPGQPLLDAIRLQVEGEECVLDGHALARILWVARTLADAEPGQPLGALAKAVGVPSQALLSLRSEVTYLAEDAMRRPGGATIPTLSGAGRQNPGASAPGTPEWIPAAVRGLMQGAFVDLAEAELRERLQAACALLTGTHGPQLVLEAKAERYVPLLTAGLAEDWLDGLELRTENPSSTLTLAARRGEPMRYAGPSAGPGRSTLDWQLDRWLGGAGFVAWPWQVGARRGVAVFAAGESADPGQLPGHRSSLLTAALGELLRERRRVAERTAQDEAARSQYLERARRVRHEASSPLTLIRSYLDLLRERAQTDDKTRAELAMLGSEVDRVGQILRSLTGAPAADTEPARCRTDEVIRDIATLCTDTLFASRGIRVDLRLAPELPEARMPRSVLRQVLLNLVKNSAEAMPRGGRVSLSSSGPVSVDGRLCIELRVVDTGPGMGPERLRQLFADEGSAKGEGHDGIGLSIVRDLLHEYDAAMICRSQPKAGTGMQLFIPAEA